MQFIIIRYFKNRFKENLQGTYKLQIAHSKFFFVPETEVTMNFHMKDPCDRHYKQFIFLNLNISAEKLSLNGQSE